MRNLTSLNLVLVALFFAGCNRIPLTPPTSGQPQFGFEILWGDVTARGDEATGAWNFAVDSVDAYVDHSVTYTDAVSGDVWELIYHRIPASPATQWSTGELAHRPLSNTVGTGSIDAPLTWQEWAVWTVNGLSVEPDFTGHLPWSADEDGNVTITCELEAYEGGDELEQEIEIEFQGLNTCDAEVLPRLFMVNPGNNPSEDMWHFYPPTNQPNVTWKWIVNGDEVIITNGGEPMHLEPENDDWNNDMVVRLVAEEEDNHPYGIFEVVYRVSWEGGWDDDDWDEWIIAGAEVDIAMTHGLPTDWMELRHLPAGGVWYASELLCHEAAQPEWKFEITSVFDPESDGLYPVAEQIEFDLALPLRQEGQWSAVVSTAHLSGVWPVAAFE